MTESNLILKDERLDDLQVNNLKIIQNPKFFCFGIDAVLLSDFVTVKKNGIVLDLGTGTGIIPILLSAKSKASKIIGLEIQQQSYNMAKRSILYNNLESRVEVVLGDIKEACNIFKGKRFDTIVSNPPYIANNEGLINDIKQKSIARHEILCTLKDIIKCSSTLLNSNGSFYMIHKPHRITDIIDTMREYKIELKTIRFISAYADNEPKMVLIHGVRNGNSGVRVLPTLVIYNKDGTLTNEVQEIYKNTNKDRI
jgi:tRNA1Val (adenine37-N6)-methyltransferase